ncbi:hypothetical protein BH24ACT5_BH24ACT5_02300 [soil metagenome]
MAMSLNRRELIHRGAVGAGLVVAGNLGSLFPGVASARGPLAKSVKNGARLTSARAQGRGYGQLVADPDKLLDLPEGFSYRIISEAGKATTDGGVIPDRFDGTGLIAAHGRSFLIRNSEQGTESTTPAKAAPEFTYDPIAEGGTTTVELDADLNVVAEYVSLAGTAVNCAGGLTPWGTWLTCEETEDVTGDDGYEKDHGFVFEVDPVNIENNQDPTPLTALGRFKHEAVAVDPTTGVRTSPMTPAPRTVCCTGRRRPSLSAGTARCAPGRCSKRSSPPTAAASYPTCPSTARSARCSRPAGQRCSIPSPPRTRFA